MTQSWLLVFAKFQEHISEEISSDLRRRRNVSRVVAAHAYIG